MAQRAVDEIKADIEQAQARREAAWDAGTDEITHLYQELASVRADAAVVKFNLDPNWAGSVADCAKLALGGLDEENESSEEEIDIGNVRFTITAEVLDDEDEE